MTAAPAHDSAGKRAGRGRARRRLLVALAVLATAAATAAAAVASLTRLETFGGREVESAARPGWSGPCFWRPPRRDRALLARCARATGVVAQVRARGPDRKDEVHFALLGRFGALVVKLGDPHRLRTPSVGERVTVIGPLVRASNGMREIWAWSLR